MITTIFISKNNTSTRKTIKWFQDNEIPFRIIEKITEEDLKEILRQSREGLSEILKRTANKKRIEKLPLSAALHYLVTCPQMIRSPILLNGKQMQVGYHAENIRSFIPKKQRIFKQSV